MPPRMMLPPKPAINQQASQREVAPIAVFPPNKGRLPTLVKPHPESPGSIFPHEIPSNNSDAAPKPNGEPSALSQPVFPSSSADDFLDLQEISSE